ncbi:MAG: polyprenyl synthetase family protein [Bacteroidales bacterium]|nr:polyprenyl synthetase family protein [Bacteroidales bacterium]
MYNEKYISDCIKSMFDGIRFPEKPEGLYDPLRYMIEIGGKRIRPTLCLTACSLYSDSFDESVLESAAALEVFHAFTLIHDDIMDRSPLRRGMPTVWKKWSEVTGVLSGDVMLIEAYKRMAKAPGYCRSQALELFSRTAAEVCEGQQFDMEFESMVSVPMDSYKRMIGLKTAVLLACSARLGAMLGGAPEADCDALYNYGYELGMAFQVADDYLDAFGDEKVFGKPIGGDIVNRKMSWLNVRALEKSTDGSFREVFDRPCPGRAEEQEKISRARAIYESLGVDTEAREEIGLYTRRAMDAVAGLGADTEPLHLFAERLVKRAK